MKKFKIIALGIIVLTTLSFVWHHLDAQNKDPWTQKQLMQPADLAKIINEGNKTHTYVYSVGPSALIKNSIDIGQCRSAGNVAKLKAELSKLPKDADIVIYCGCCPFANCPNVRPAFNLLIEMHFTNHKLLNLTHNIKTDWIDKVYPLVD